MEWVEAVGKTVDEAIKAAMKDLSVESRDAVDIEVVDEPKKGFLGLGGQEARVRVSTKPKSGRRRSRGRRSKDGRGQQGRGEGAAEDQKGARGGKTARNGKHQESRRDDVDGGKARSRKGNGRSETKKVAVDTPKNEKADIEEQAEIAKAFTQGLLEAFQLEGTVDTRIEDDVLFVDIAGDETEALVGRKGTVLQAIHELTRTVIQRKTFGAPRMRLDIAGYAARRREALKIYAGRLAERVKEEQKEAMLEPMNAADRKVVHDAIAEIEGVRSYSEGEDPSRSVVVAPSEQVAEDDE